LNRPEKRKRIQHLRGTCKRKIRSLKLLLGLDQVKKENKGKINETKLLKTRNKKSQKDSSTLVQTSSTVRSKIFTTNSKTRWTNFSININKTQNSTNLKITWSKKLRKCKPNHKGSISHSHNNQQNRRKRTFKQGRRNKDKINLP